MKKGQMLIITAVVILVSLGAVFMWAEGGITKEVTIGQTHAAITDAFSLGQTINNYLGDSAELSKCNTISKIIDFADTDEYTIGEGEEIETYASKEEYFEAMFRYNFYVYMADFPIIKKTSLEDKYSLFNSLFFDIQFNYEETDATEDSEKLRVLKEIKGAPGWIEYEDKAFVDYLEIASEEGFVYKIKPIFSIDLDLDFDDISVLPEECSTLIEAFIEEVTGTCSNEAITDELSCSLDPIQCSDRTSQTEDICEYDGETWTENTWDETTEEVPDEEDAEDVEAVEETVDDAETTTT